MKKTIATKKEAWLHAVRLRTLPLALASIFAGSIVAAYQGIFRWEIFILASLTTIFLQVLSNLSNDYGDSVHGADSKDRSGPVRAVQSGVISLTEMKKAMYLFGMLSFISGISLVYIALNDWLLFTIFLVLGLLAIWAAISYTSGSNPYGYVGLGDISVFIFFGILGVVGTYFLHGLQFDWDVLLIGSSLGCFSTAVLNINNIRDIESDEKAGKRSIPVRIGRKAAVRYNWSLILGGNLFLIGYAVLIQSPKPLFAFIALPLMILIGLGVQKAKDAHSTDPFLKKMALSTLLWVILFGFGLLLF
ncbi:1,4-dihydroxy-2-naphthoate polyprenyltransferase [Algoriphagus kandeliae]|uniref:1,4-dihydroxy-2-naphthoate octaprenyltransferase n=1 Tax=Algoriphagus kandeliae TaxID=2562278 RepID=A0A4Y9R113_9BACT|nr:1,4-dihydroxy-2-naphthoate polyprenyltransferase [Algoriphagus kandeliae]TFV97878.1 1,4-dihydroxy-2-naphthoate polyprenyltransferase [Algoriphagus kandeliae]